MLFLVSAVSQKSDRSTAQAGEPVVPNFPVPPSNTFLSLASWNYCALASVAEIAADPDTLLKGMVKQFPGLPAKLHENYIVAVATAVANDTPGTRYSVITGEQTQLINNETGAVNTLWTRQPLKGDYDKRTIHSTDS